LIGTAEQPAIIIGRLLELVKGALLVIYKLKDKERI